MFLTFSKLCASCVLKSSHSFGMDCRVPLDSAEEQFCCSVKALSSVAFFNLNFSSLCWYAHEERRLRRRMGILA